jgi:hypothetical protein
MVSVAAFARPASADLAHNYESEITGPSLGEQFVQPWGLDVDSSGNLYVGDAEGKAVDIFSGLGVLEPPQLDDETIETVGGETPFTGEYVRSVAVDNLPGPDQGMVYVAESNHEYVDVFKPEAAGKYKLLQERKFKGYMYVAFDNSSGPNKGSLYIFEDLQVVRVKLNAAGTLPESEGEPGVTTLPTPEEAFHTGEDGSGGLAVGPTGKVYVANPAASAVDIYSNTGKLEPVAIDGASVPSGAGIFEPIAVDVDAASGDVYVVDGHRKVVDQFASTGEYITQIAGPEVEPRNLEPFQEPLGVATDASGNVYVSDGGAKAVDIFSPTVVVPSVSPEAGLGREEKATLHGTVNPDGVAVTACEFEYGTTTEYGATAPCAQSPAEIGAGAVGVPVAVQISGLEPRTVYHWRLVATNTNGANRSADATFTTVTAPAVEGESVLAAGASTATIAAEVDPAGAETSYQVEYGASESYGASAPLPEGRLSGGLSAQSVTVELHALQEHTLYHYRLVASNEAGIVYGEDATFATASEGGPTVLPDDRAWEMVSAPNKHGGYVRPLAEEDAVQASLDGSAFAFLGEQSLLSEAQGSSVFDEVLARRTSAGWSDEDIATAHDAPPGQGIGAGQEYRLFSPDLSSVLVQPLGPFTALSPEATERTPYIRDDEVGSYLPLLTAMDVPSGTKFGGDPEKSNGPVDVLDATPDLSHVLLDTSEQVALTATPAEDALYEWSAGKLQLVSVAPEAAGGAPVEGAFVGDHNEDSRNAMSSDGSLVFWEGLVEAHSHLYVRDTETEKTLQIDTPEAGYGEGIPEPEFQIASADGSEDFFTDAQHLTQNAGPAGRDLYECDLKRTPGVLSCHVKDLTVALGAGKSAEVLGQTAVLGASEDGSYIYVLARGVLALNKNEATGEEASEGADNLYVLHNNGTEWTTSFIATLSAVDEENELRRATARVSPDGRHLAFMSDRSLTGYDNHDVASGQPDEEVFLYDAEAKPHLICASCDRTGARPVGALESGRPRLPVFAVVDGPRTWEHTWLAANVPTEEDFGRNQARYQPRYLSNSGRLFFNSVDALVPQDINEGWDVYEYEPSGVGSCVEGGATYDADTGGCVSLISSGRSTGESGILGASESGADVFFLTDAKLAAQDIDEQFDVYDAHECSLSPCVAPVATAAPLGCTEAETCRSVPEDQILGGLASATLSSDGNIAPAASKPPPTQAQRLSKALKTCHRKPKKRRSSCERRVRRAYGPARKPTQSRGRGK